MNKSFTLIEILTVILIVGVLSGIIIVATNSVIDSTQDAKRKKDLDSISKALMEYGIMTGSYPVEASDCNIGDGTCLDELIDTGYTKNFPLDPSGTRYKYSSDGTTYTIKTVLSDNQTLAYSPDTGYSQYQGLIGYSKRKSITVSNSGSALTDYQVKVDVTYDSDMQADFDDLRFTLSDGATELSHWLESKTDSSTATFWVKIPSLSSGDNTIYAYYGNASASSASNGDNTFEFFDDFEGSSLNGSKWTSSGTPAVNSSIVTLSGTANEQITSISTFDINYAILAQAKFIATLSSQQVCVGFNNDIEDTYATEIFRYYNDNYYYGYNKDNTGGSGSSNSLSSADSNFHRFEIIRNSTTNTKFNCDNGTFQTLATKVPSGSLPINLYLRYASGGEASLDWISIRKYISTEPTISAWGSEESI